MVVDERYTYAGFWSRFGASLLDMALSACLTFPLLISVYGWEYLDPDKTGFFAGPLDFLVTIGMACLTLTFWMVKQATPGKMAISAKIVDAETGRPASKAQLIGRYFAYWVSTIPLGLGFLWVAIDRRKQGWHDKLSGTVVIRLVDRGPVPVTFKGT